MKIIRIAAVVLAAVTAVLVVGGLVMDDAFGVRSTVVVDAPLDVAMAHVVDMEKHTAWSPWKHKDPSMVITYGPTTVGEGAFYTWTSDNSGSGKHTLTEVEDLRVEDLVEFDGMGEGHGFFTFEPMGEQTKVTWGFDSHMEVFLLGPWMVRVMDMEGLLQQDFDLGTSLYAEQVHADMEARAKAAAEAAAMAEAEAATDEAAAE